MYISQVILTVHDSYEQHQAIWSLFAHVPDRRRDHLFRVEESDSKVCKVLLQSSTKPIRSAEASVLATRKFSPTVLEGGYYKFKILAYPTKRCSDTKKIIEIKGADETVQWLQRKLAGANVNVTSLDTVMVRNKQSHNSRFICFEGILQVVSAEAIERVLVMGVGRKKHAGAGLLSLARTQ